MDGLTSFFISIGSMAVTVITIITNVYTNRKQREHDSEMRKYEREHDYKMREQEHEYDYKMREQEIDAEKELKKQELYMRNELEIYKDFGDKYARLIRYSTLPVDEHETPIKPDTVDHEKVSAFLSSVSHLQLIVGINVDNECSSLCLTLEANNYLTGSYSDDLFHSIIEKIKRRQDEIRKT